MVLTSVPVTVPPFWRKFGVLIVPPAPLNVPPGLRLSEVAEVSVPPSRLYMPIEFVPPIARFDPAKLPAVWFTVAALRVPPERLKLPATFSTGVESVPA